MIFVTFIRHGESMDNLRSVWAGWKDAPLSNHGMAQAQAMAKSFSSLDFAVIYASPLKRAHSTAEALLNAQPDPKPPLIVSPLVREQHFGIAEGQPWSMTMTKGLSLEEHFEQKIYPVLTGRDNRFPEGESLNDLQARAETAINELIIPHIWENAKIGWKDMHIAIVSHGLCISELVAALLRKDATGHGAAGHKWTGLLNTAWTRVQIDIPALQPGQSLTLTDENYPSLAVKVTHNNVHDHLDEVKRQRGGIGSAAYDPKQQDIRSFFGGGGAAATEEVLEEGRSVSNVYDETPVDQKL